MFLNIAINGQSISNVALDPARRKDAAYLKAVKRLLTMKHHALIAAMDQTPTFYIEVPSRMGNDNNRQG